MELIVETKNLSKRYGAKLAVDCVDMHVERGSIYGLIGANGAGKTSLMKLLLGLTERTAGQIRLFGSDDLEQSRRRIGSLIEAPGIYKNCTAFENMLRFTTLYGADKNEIMPLLDLVGLSAVANKKTGGFSLGMKQRLGIAVALIGHPELLILDEPVNGLDPAGIKLVRDIVCELSEKGVTVIISSHLLDELAKIVTHYGIIINGKLAEEITAEELISNCRKAVNIVTDETENAKSILSARFPDMKFVNSANGLRFDLPENVSTAQINRILVENGVAVYELTAFGSGLEDYFIERLKK